MAGISLFEVMGKEYGQGPSSSHTAGAASMALLARRLFPGRIQRVDFTLYGSFARTYRGHGTDRALLGGIMGFETDDLRIRDFLTWRRKGFHIAFQQRKRPDDIHPNTADMDIYGTKGGIFLSGAFL